MAKKRKSTSSKTTSSSAGRKARKVSVDVQAEGGARTRRQRAVKTSTQTQLEDAISIPEYQISISVGTTLEKQFLDEHGNIGWYEGRITEIGENKEGKEIMRIEYSDGDEEYPTKDKLVEEIEGGLIDIASIKNANEGDDASSRENDTVSQDSNEEVYPPLLNRDSDDEDSDVVDEDAGIISNARPGATRQSARIRDGQATGARNRAQGNNTTPLATPEQDSARRTTRNENIPWISRRRPYVCKQVGEIMHLKPCCVCDQALLKNEWIFETQTHQKIHGDAGPGCYNSYLHPQCVSQACTKFGKKEYIAACHKNFAQNCIAIVVDKKEVPLHEHNEELYDEICQILEKHFYVDANVCVALKRAFFYNKSEQIDRSYVPFLHTDVEDGPINLPPNSLTLEVCGEEIQFEGIAIRKRNKQEDNIFFCSKEGCCWGGIHKAKNEADVTDDSKDIYRSICSQCDEGDEKRTYICKKCNTLLYGNDSRTYHTIEKCKETQEIIPYQKMVYKCELPENANMRSVINALITDKASPFSFLFERDTVYDQGISNQDDGSDPFGFNRMSTTMGLFGSQKKKMFARYTDWFEHVEGVGILFKNVTPEEHINMSMMVEELAYVSFVNAHHGIILSSPKSFGHGIRETRNASNAGKESFLLYFTGAKPKHNHSLKANFRKGRKGRERERELYEQKQKEEHRYQTNFIYQHIKNCVSSGGSVV